MTLTHHEFYEDSGDESLLEGALLLAAALAATAAMQGDFGRPSSSPGMPVRRPRRPAAASAAVAADAEPDLSCAVEDERTAKPPIG